MPAGELEPCDRDQGYGHLDEYAGQPCRPELGRRLREGQQVPKNEDIPACARGESMAALKSPASAEAAGAAPSAPVSEKGEKRSPSQGSSSRAPCPKKAASV
eukprot:1135439-Pyramimonas_sp.AAC.1